jgi:hypothetical protein
MFFLEYQTLDNVKKLSIPKCNTAKLEPFKFGLELYGLFVYAPKLNIH